MAYHTLRQEYMLMPPVTRAYTTVCLLTSIAVVSYNFSCVLTSFHAYSYVLSFLATGCGITFPAIFQSFAHNPKI